MLTVQNIGLVRALAPLLLKDNIRINCVSPGMVILTEIYMSELNKVQMATRLSDGWREGHNDWVTPMPTLVKAFLTFVEDERLTGCLLEASGPKCYFHDEPPYQNAVIKSIMDSDSVAQKPVRPDDMPTVLDFQTK